jgi:hypothetical protein
MHFIAHPASRFVLPKVQPTIKDSTLYNNDIQSIFGAGSL